VKYSDAQCIKKMLETTNKLSAYLESEHITSEVILAQEPVRWAITTPLYYIGEHAYQLSDEFKAAHPEAPWSKISGLRHRLVHDYENTNWSLICSILFDVLPDFCVVLQDIQRNI